MPGYAVTADIPTFGLASETLVNFAPEQQQAQLDAASDFADSFLAARFPVPLANPGLALKEAVVVIASWRLLTVRGFDPEDKGDVELKQRYDEALAWLKGIAESDITPAGATLGAGGAPAGGPVGSGIVVQMNTVPGRSGYNPLAKHDESIDADGNVIYISTPKSRGWY